jgi:hypothetical protein
MIPYNHPTIGIYKNTLIGFDDFQDDEVLGKIVNTFSSSTKILILTTPNKKWADEEQTLLTNLYRYYNYGENHIYGWKSGRYPSTDLYKEQVLGTKLYRSEILAEFI